MSTENLEHPKESGEKSEQEKILKNNIICAWCKKEIGTKEGLKEGKISHSICQDCKEKYFPVKK
ncbi:MAG: hypothetical protein HYV51_01445 [Parcubacteria group bacterium]|nr:hypothetical protein [Parcubacteria group bacterium]